MLKPLHKGHLGTNIGVFVSRRISYRCPLFAGAFIRDSLYNLFFGDSPRGEVPDAVLETVLGHVIVGRYEILEL